MFAIHVIIWFTVRVCHLKDYLKKGRSASLTCNMDLLDTHKYMTNHSFGLGHAHVTDLAYKWYPNIPYKVMEAIGYC